MPYKNKEGRIEKIPASYNSYLSKALEESMQEAMGEIISKDANLTIQTNGEIDNVQEFMKVYPIIKQNKKQELVQRIKENLEKIQRQNPDIEIAGLKIANKGNVARGE